MKGEKNLGTVLVIEDEGDVRSVVSLTLTSWGYDVVGFGNGQEAKEFLLKSAPGSLPQVAVLDLNLPGITGTELCRWLKSGTLGSDVAVLILTADASDRQKVSLLEGGADDYLTKPFNIDELRGHVDSLMKMRELRVAKCKAEEDNAHLTNGYTNGLHDEAASDNGGQEARILEHAEGSDVANDELGETLAAKEHRQKILNSILCNLGTIQRSSSESDQFALAVEAIKTSVAALANEE